jgi:hypothetical protein
MMHDANGTYIRVVTGVTPLGVNIASVKDKKCAIRKTWTTRKNRSSTFEIVFHPRSRHAQRVLRVMRET